MSAENHRARAGHTFRVLVLIEAALLSASAVFGGVPPLMNYQGYLRNGASHAPYNGTRPMTFSLYADATGGSALWAESHGAVSVNAGVFTILLGSLSTLPESLFARPRLWLETAVSDTLLTPRRPIVTVGYAFKAAKADTASWALGTSAPGQWSSTGQDVYRPAGNVGIGITTPYSKLHINGNRSTGTDTTRLTMTQDASGRGALVELAAGTVSDANPYFAINTRTPSGTPETLERMRIDQDGNVGIGTTSPSYRLDVLGNSRVASVPLGGGAITAQFLEYPNRGAILFDSDRTGYTFVLGNQRVSDGNILPIITMYDAGNVGIGTSTPAYKLDVAGGTRIQGDLCVTGAKNAIVRTSRGMTKVYSEESAEVWFTDYGRARLNAGSCHVELTPLFLETVTVSDKDQMMVFLQEEGDSNGLVVTPGKTGFDVHEKAHGQSDATFSYRVVAKRKGFERERLAPVGGSR